MKFKKTFLKNEVLGNVSVVIRDAMIDQRRWVTVFDLIFRHGGKLYQTTYQRGSTEAQDEAPFEYDPDEIECQEVEAYDKTITDFRPVAATEK